MKIFVFFKNRESKTRLLNNVGDLNTKSKRKDIKEQGVYQPGEPGKLRENELTQGNHGKLRVNDKDSEKINFFLLCLNTS